MLSCMLENEGNDKNIKGMKKRRVSRVNGNEINWHSFQKYYRKQCDIAWRYVDSSYVFDLIFYYDKWNYNR